MNLILLLLKKNYNYQKNAFSENLKNFENLY